MRLKISSILISLVLTTGFTNKVGVAQNPELFNNIGFEQNFNIYQWRYGFNYTKNIQENGLLILTEDFKSSLLRIRKNENKWKDDQRFGIDLTWQFSPKWVGKLVSSSIYFSDKLSGITNDIKTSFGSIGIQYNPIYKINILSLIGYKFDTRFDQFDHGLVYHFDVKTLDFKLKEYDNRINFSIKKDEFVTRKNKDISFNYYVKKEFYTDTTDSLSFVWYQKRRDNYDRWDTNDLFIESLNEEFGAIKNILNYKVSDFIKLSLNSNVSSKWSKVSKLIHNKTDEVRFKKDFSSFNQLNLYVKTSRVIERIKLSYYTEDQKNDIPDSLKNLPFSYRFSYVSPDFNISTLTLANNLNFIFSKFDTMTTNFMISIFRYNTPEKTNYDDRDELRINASLSEVHYFYPVLKLKLNIGVNLKHLVFIYGQMSANNNWTRIFSINPELFYRPNKKFNLYQAFEVLANYVDYDFDQQSTPLDIRSYVFRKFVMQNVLEYHFDLLTTFSVNYKLELEENGKLFWNEWTEMIIKTRQNHYCNAYFDFQLFPGAIISIGAIFLKRKEHLQILRSSNTNELNNYVSFSPLIQIKYEPHSKLKFLFTGSKCVKKMPLQKHYFINNININLSWYM